MDELFDFEAKLPLIPEEPGVYLMKDRRGKIIYVGKSVNLKARVRSYFNGGDPRPFVARLSKVLGDIETLVTATEKEALILENTLIKAHKPKYNVMLRDDKNYLSLKIDTKSAWPRVEVVRKLGRDGRYFGPYHSATAIRSTLRVLNKHFLLRTCSDSTLASRTRPCLQYQIKRCPAPCALPVHEQDYADHVHNAILFLDGKHPELVRRLRDKMAAAAGDLEFELAAHYRDQIRAIDTALQRQQAVSSRFADQDVFGLCREGDRLTVQALFVRKGKLEGGRAFSFSDVEFPDGEILSSFVNMFYASGKEVPKEVLTPVALEDAGTLAALLSDLRGNAVKVWHPSRGGGRELVDTANKNALVAFEEQHSQRERTTDVLAKLQTKLRLPVFPARIECYDISNFQGDVVVGSMVVFEHGEPARAEYRHFRIKTVTGQDDFASMYEVLTRRLKRSIEDTWPMPDLVVIDGGKGQLGQATTVASDLGLDELAVVSLAKARVEADVQAKEITRTLERVFLPGRKNPLILRQNSAELFVLQRIRDEAHRFAIEYHRKLRRKKTLASRLDDIPGIGKKRRKALLTHFGGLAAIKTAPVEALTAVEGISTATARTIFAYFNSEAALDG